MAEAGGGACAQSVAVTRSIIKKYKKPIWHRFIGACKDYALVNAGDRVAVCISGGKDSFLLAKCMQHLQRVSDVPFEVEYLCMDPGYLPENRALIERNAAALGLPLHIFCTDIFDSVANVSKNPCYLCARMRRGHLYKNAQALGCNKIALGHHFDDVIETILMGMLYGGQMQTMMPKLHSTNFEGMELIRPMYLVHEEAILDWAHCHDLHFLQCACRFTEAYEVDEHGANNSKRQEMKELIRRFRRISPVIEKNIFRSVENVNLDTIISYKQGNNVHHFLDDYDKR